MKTKLLFVLILTISFLQNAIDAQNVTYKGIQINDNIREGYKQYSKDWAQANITGFNKGKQYNNIMSAVLIIDNQLSNGNLPAHDYSIQDPQKNVLASFNAKDSRSIALALLYSYLDKTVEANPQLEQTTQSSTYQTKNYFGFMDPMRVIAQNYFGGDLKTFESGWKDKTTYDENTRRSYIKEALLSQIIKLDKVDFTDPINETVGIDKDVFNNLKSTGELEKFKAKLKENLTNSELFRIADRLSQGAIVRKLLGEDNN